MTGLLEDHEAFLRAIFDAPDDDTPRLVYADYLDENGEPLRAEFIRVQCGSNEPGRPPPEWARPDEPDGPPPTFRRGFRVGGTAMLDAGDLTDPVAFRRLVVARHPQWYGADAVKVVAGRITGGEPFDVLFACPAAARFTTWDLSGRVEELFDLADAFDDGTFSLIDLKNTPVITPAGVEALARHRGARRIEELDLADNDLDNDAARALIRSPHLTRLRRLSLLRGNRLRGRTWQQLLERFGEDVVS